MARLFPEPNQRPVVPEVGTIIEAISTKFEAESAIIMAKGRYRFQRLSQAMDVTFNIPMAQVVVLSDELITYSAAAAKYHYDDFYAAAANPWPFWLNRRYHSRPLMAEAQELSSKLVRGEATEGLHTAGADSCVCTGNASEFSLCRD
jgi:hypothetical protein